MDGGKIFNALVIQVMKIEISCGCTSFYTLIDEKSLEEVDLDVVLDYILPKVRSGIKI